MLAEVCAVWKPLSKGWSSPTGSSWARVRLRLLAMSGTVLDGCTSFYLLAAGVLLFPCRWPIHSLLPLTSPSLLPLNDQKRPPGPMGRQWKASDQQSIWCLHTWGCCVEIQKVWKGGYSWDLYTCMVVTGSAAKSLIIFIFCHKRMKRSDSLHKCRHGPAPLG